MSCVYVIIYHVHALPTCQPSANNVNKLATRVLLLYFRFYLYLSAFRCCSTCMHISQSMGLWFLYLVYSTSKDYTNVYRTHPPPTFSTSHTLPPEQPSCSALMVFIYLVCPCQRRIRTHYDLLYKTYVVICIPDHLGKCFE